MKKIVKTLVVLLVIFIAIIAGLTLAINPIIEKLRPEIVASISKAAKKPVQIGAIKTKIFPTAGIEIHDVGLAGAESDSAKLQTLLFESSVPDLLSGKVSVSRLTVEGLNLKLVKNSDGSLSIGGVKLGNDTAAAPTSAANNSTAGESGEGAPGEAALAFSVNDASISGINVSFRDESVSPAQTTSLDNLSLKFSAPNTVAQGMNVLLNFGINGKEQVELKADGSFNGEILALKSAVLQLFGGEIKLNGKFSAAPAGDFQVAVDGQGVDLGRVCDFVLTGKKSYCLKGTLQSLTANLSGNTKDVATSLNGPVALKLGEGEISGINLIGTTLGKIKDIPGVSGSLAAAVPASQQDVLSGSGTAFDSLNISGTLANNGFSLSELNLQQALYLIQGSGQIDFGGGLNLKTALKLTPAIASGMLESQPNLKLLQDEQGNLTAPVQISKQNGTLLVVPDLEQLLRRAATGKAKEAVTKGLEKILGGQKNGGGNMFKKLF